MKKITIVLFLLILLLPSSVVAEEKIIDDILADIPLDELYGYMQEESFYEIYGYSDPFSFLKDVITGNVHDINFFDAVMKMLTYEFSSTIKLASVIFLMGITGIFVKNLSMEYLSKDISSAVSLVITLFISLNISSMFFSFAGEVTEVTGNIATLLNIICPCLLILTAMTGTAATANIISPALMLSLGYGELFITGIIIPLSILMFILSIADCATEGINLKNLISVMKKGATISLGTAFTALSATISAAGFTFAGSDKIVFKTAKYAAGSLIPVVGSFLSSSAETVFSLVGVVKGGVGILGMMIILSVILSPMVKMFLVYASLKIISALLSIVTDDKITDVIERSASCMGFLLSVNLAVGVMSVMIILILVNISSAVM